MSNENSLAMRLAHSIASHFESIGLPPLEWQVTGGTFWADSSVFDGDDYRPVLVGTYPADTSRVMVATLHEAYAGALTRAEDDGEVVEGAYGAFDILIHRKGWGE